MPAASSYGRQVQAGPLGNYTTLSQRRYICRTEKTPRHDRFCLERARLCLETGLCSIVEIQAARGPLLPGRRHAEGSFMLGPWVSTQRYRKDLLPLERKQLLDAIGFVWDWPDRLWEQNFAALLKFKQREGHCRVPAYYRMCDLKLGYWVATQRRNRRQMSTERRRRLNKIGFVWSVFMRPIAYRCR